MTSRTLHQSPKRRVRRAFAFLSAATLALCMTACGSDETEGGSASASSKAEADTVLPLPDLSGQQIVITLLGGGSWADALEKDVIKPFEELTGADVVTNNNCCDNFETAVGEGQFIGDLAMGNDYGPVQAWSDAGLLTADPRFVEIGEARGIDPSLYQDDIVSVYAYGYVLAWNTDVAGDSHPTNWSEFFDTDEFTGTRGLFSLPIGDLEIASLAHGADPVNLYPLDIDESIAAIGELRDAAKINFWEGGADLQAQLGSGELAYSLAFSNRILQSKAEGLPVDMTTDNALIATGGVGIPKTAKNVDGAMAFVDFYLTPEVQAAMARDAGVAPAYSDAVELLPEDLQADQVTSPEAMETAIIMDNAWWAENFPTAAQDFSSFLAQ